MALHAKNIVVIAGAKGEEIEKVASIIAQEKKVTVDRAKEVLKELRK